MLYRILWFSVIHQQESAIGVPMYPPSQTSLHCPSHLTLQPVAEPLFEFPESHSKFPLAICFTRGIINFYVTLSIRLPFSLLSSHLVHRSVLYVCFSIAALKINFLSAISSDSIYMCHYTIFIFLFLTYFTLYNGF